MSARVSLFGNRLLTRGRKGLALFLATPRGQREQSEVGHIIVEVCINENRFAGLLLASMLHGVQVRLHPGTVCRLEAPGRDFHGSHCTAHQFVADKAKWHVTLKGKAEGKPMLVPESMMCLSHCLLPQSVSRVRKHVQLIEEEAQGSCGRGLIVDQPVAPGAPLFEEPPMMLSSAGGERHNDRWRAYLTLMMGASQTDGEFAATLAAFEYLGVSDLPQMRTSTEAAASKILGEAVAASGGDVSQMPAEQLRGQQDKVTGALMRFQSNQFKFDNYAASGGGAVEGGATRFSAAALFAFTAKMNHCCQPSVFVDRRWSPHVAGAREASDGVLQIRALRALRSGERLTINQGP